MTPTITYEEYDTYLGQTKKMGTQPDAKLCNDVQAVSRTAEDMAFTHGITVAQFSSTDGFACSEAMLALQKQKASQSFSSGWRLGKIVLDGYRAGLKMEKL